MEIPFGVIGRGPSQRLGLGGRCCHDVVLAKLRPFAVLSRESQIGGLPSFDFDFG